MSDRPWGLDFDGLLALSGARVEVGAPGGNNARLLYLHAKGSPIRGIPPRPVLEIALEDPGVQGAVAEMFAAAAAAALEGDPGAALSSLEAAGALAEAAVKAYFDGGNLAPNAPSTVKTKGKNAPLVDSGGLRASIAHRVERG